MDAQQPAEGISKGPSWADAHTYKVECDCGDSDHAIHAWIEVQGDTDTKDVSLSFYVKSWIPVWDKKFSRIRTAFRVLFGGHLEHEHHIILNKQVATNFLSALEKSIEELDAQHTTQESSVVDQV
jgi:hypothetical protein